MSEACEKLHSILDKFKNSPECVGYDMRLHLAEMVMSRLNDLGWSPKRLAQTACMDESFIVRIINADTNCTFDDAGRIMFALSKRLRLALDFNSVPKCYICGNHATRIIPAPIAFGNLEFELNYVWPKGQLYCDYHYATQGVWK